MKKLKYLSIILTFLMFLFFQNDANSQNVDSCTVSGGNNSTFIITTYSDSTITVTGDPFLKLKAYRNSPYIESVLCQINTGTPCSGSTYDWPSGEYDRLDIHEIGTWTACNVPITFPAGGCPNEICNGIDDDCDGLIDEGVQTTFYADTDNDGYGDPNNDSLACSAPTGYVSNNTDCDDNNSNIHPNATETCNGIDDDCDGQTDEGVLTTFYADTDSDGYGNPNSSTLACSAPTGYVSNSSDCNDNNASIYTGATCDDGDSGTENDEYNSSCECEGTPVGGGSTYDWPIVGSNINYDGSGNVGIGESNPTYKLSVNGNVGAKEYRATPNGWSDYVFEENYQLMSLGDVENFIKENQHLPNIPSEKEVLKDGILLGEMNSILLAKIEELTLHVIELNKEIEKLKAKN